MERVRIWLSIAGFGLLSACTGPNYTKAGMSPDIPEAIAQGRRPPSLSEEETVIYDFFTQLLTKKDVADDTYQAAVQRFGEKSVVELICTAGYYSFVSLVLNANRTPVPEGGTPLPTLSAGG